MICKYVNSLCSENVLENTGLLFSIYFYLILAHNLKLTDIQITLHDRKTVSVIFAKMAEMHTALAVFQELWLVDSIIKELRTGEKLFSEKP